MNNDLMNFYEQMNEVVEKTYYYTLEKYRAICEDISRELYIERFNEFKSYYSNNPVAFAEDYLGVKLKWYQRYLLKDKLPILRNMMNNIRNKYISDLFK